MENTTINPLILDKSECPTCGIRLNQKVMYPRCGYSFTCNATTGEVSPKEFDCPVFGKLINGDKPEPNEQ